MDASAWRARVPKAWRVDLREAHAHGLAVDQHVDGVTIKDGHHRPSQLGASDARSDKQGQREENTGRFTGCGHCLYRHPGPLGCVQRLRLDAPCPAAQQLLVERALLRPPASGSDAAALHGR